MPELSDDELLLNRYADGELTDRERMAFEDRLEKDPGLRSRLAELVSLNTALEIGLSQTKALSDRCSIEPPCEKVTPGGRRKWAIGAAAAVGLIVLGAGTWWALRGDRSSRLADPLGVIERLDSSFDRVALRAQVTELLNPATAVFRRLEIYESWSGLPLPAIEPLVWAMAQREEHDAARENLYMTLTVERPVEDYAALIAAARREWSRRALRSLAALIPHLRTHPCPESEALLSEVLAARRSLPPVWIGQRIPTFLAIAPKSASIESQVNAALHDPDELVRAWAGLARAENHQRDGIECARSLLTSEIDEVRRLAVTAVVRHGLDTDLPALVPLSNDPYDAVRQLVRQALLQHHIPFPSNP